MGIVNTLYIYAEKLEALHQHIEERRIPVASKDDMGAQVLELERYLGIADYSAAISKRRIAIITLIIAFLPIAFFSLLLCLNSEQGYQLLGIDVKPQLEAIYRFTFDYVLVVGAYLVLMIGVFGYYYWTNSRILSKIDAVIQQFMQRTCGQ